MNKISLSAIFTLFLSLTSCGSGPQKEPENEVEKEVKTPIILYQGRIDTNNDSTPIIIWQSTTIEIEFTGDFLQIGFNQLKGQVYFDIEIDGFTSLIQAKDGWIQVGVRSGSERHTLRMFKRSEADVGHVGFLGFKTKPNGGDDTITVFNAPSTSSNNSAKKYLFFGDSITAGACNEDGNEDQWENYSTHNNALSYGAITAETLNAEYRNISVSGMGITMGYNKLLFKEVWDRTYPDPRSAQVDFSLWQPDAIFINFGENDDSYSSNQNQSFPSNFTSEYVSVVKNIRKAYPASTIVILRGGMYGGAQSERLRGPWNQVVSTLEASDKNIKHFVFEHWSSKHPRVSDHKKMAEELSDWASKNL